jgi:hypothetical protein
MFAEVVDSGITTAIYDKLKEHAEADAQQLKLKETANGYIW